MSIFFLGCFPSFVVPGISSAVVAAPMFFNNFKDFSTFVIAKETCLFNVQYPNGIRRKIIVEKDGYACLTGAWSLEAGCAAVIIVEDWIGLSMTGGPIEHKGRLKYIDGCTDTLLIGPPKIGDPCLNHLHFPKGIRQTMHTHPTVRIGMVVKGSGRAISPNGESKLFAGLGWVIPAGAEHCFYTDDETMDIIAFHPDSDTGPADENHPMVNRTIVDGVSAAKIDEIRTK